LFLALSPNSPDPMYKQLTDQIKNAIASGDVRPGDKLPSVRELAEGLKTSAITVKRAYLDLENEGYILTRAGLGSYVTDIDRERLRKEKLAEFKTALKAILATGAKYGVGADDLARLIHEIRED
jgi:GntR family transcriptional regulator